MITLTKKYSFLRPNLTSKVLISLCQNRLQETLACMIVKRPAVKAPKVLRYGEVPVGYYGGRHLITMLPGTGIGPEMMGYVLDVIKTIRAPIDFEVIPIREENYDADLAYAITSIRRNKACLKAGSIENASKAMHHTSANVEIMRRLDMYANVTKCVAYEGVNSKRKHVNIAVIRQNTEGEYCMLEHETKVGLVESLKIVTRHNCIRLAEWTLKYCMDEDRKKITVVHKANIMKFTDGLFLKQITEILKLNPNFEVDDMIVDNCSMQLVENPGNFDVIVTSNLYGAVINSIACGLTGGAGITSGRNYGDHYALFETATRNTASAKAGLNVANPVAVLHATSDLLFHLRHETSAFLLRRAIQRSIQEGFTTEDLGGKFKSDQVVDKIKEYIREELLMLPAEQNLSPCNVITSKPAGST